MFGIGIPELVVLLAILIFVFGAKKIPQLMEGIGKGIRTFKKGINEKEEDALSVKVVGSEPKQLS